MTTIADLAAQLGTPTLIRAARRSAQLTQAELSALTGISRRTLQSFEAPQDPAQPTTADLICTLIACRAYIAPHTSRTYVDPMRGRPSQSLADFLEVAQAHHPPT